ncbi:multifunctional expression regulator [Gallid alphaherpesvirus 1]|nr:multifunctional expression regulator [Gallid alphaherpesvirus 1]
MTYTGSGPDHSKAKWISSQTACQIAVSLPFSTCSELDTCSESVEVSTVVYAVSFFLTCTRYINPLTAMGRPEKSGRNKDRRETRSRSSSNTSTHSEARSATERTKDRLDGRSRSRSESRHEAHCIRRRSHSTESSSRSRSSGRGSWKRVRDSSDRGRRRCSNGEPRSRYENQSGMSVRSSIRRVSSPRNKFMRGRAHIQVRRGIPPRPRRRAGTPEKRYRAPIFTVSLKHSRRSWERNRDELRRPIWRDFVRCPTSSRTETKELRNVTPAQYFEKAATAFGGLGKCITEELRLENQKCLLDMVNRAVDDDDCDDIDRDRGICFPAFLSSGSSDLAADAAFTSWKQFCGRAASLKGRWTSRPDIARLAKISRAVYLANCSFEELLFACDETLVWMLWHQFEDERIYPHDPIFSNIYCACQSLAMHLGPILPCYLSSIGSQLRDTTRSQELSLSSAKCPLTLLLTFFDRFSRIVYPRPEAIVMNHKAIDPARTLWDMYYPGTCSKKIPLVLAQHANVCRKEECRVVCAQLLSRQYTVGKFFSCDLF